MRAVAGTVLARPWFDRAGLFALGTLFFPVSRLWAAARASSGDVDAFYDAVPLQPRLEDRGRLRRALGKFEEARAGVNAIETEWQRVFFGGEAAPVPYLVAVESARLKLRHAYNATRRHFRFLASRQTPRVKLAIDTPAAVEALYGPETDREAHFQVLGALPIVEVSQRLPSETGTDFWLRFPTPSPRLGDTVWARVHEPEGGADAPTIIYGHGICVEFDHWHGMVDECRALVRRGFRVIRPEAPWHGRRVVPGHFGGERIIGAFPTAILDALTGAVQEWRVLAEWARATSKGPILLAGSSLGALTAQLVADHARQWPEACRPQAMLLVTHTGDLAEAVIAGALTPLWASPEIIERSGWTPEDARRVLALLDPGTELAFPPERIVSVLGKRDVILPFSGGESLVARWKVPERNVFVWDRGHFSVPMTLIRDPAPLERLSEIARVLRS